MTDRSDRIDEVDRPPAGWFLLDVMRKGSRKWDWVALMVDIDPDDMKWCEKLEGPVMLFVNPYEWQPQPGCSYKQCYVRIPGKHRNGDAAHEALCAIIAATLN